jgi:hypothetical protein
LRRGDGATYWDWSFFGWFHRIFILLLILMIQDEDKRAMAGEILAMEVQVSVS